ncbi:hypothetical protein F0562_003331 [Nyssa sinensis]|uniref:Uncharacterized protein n=1 Tax=Nyssa sinensis TaxID=561372 RepID=A0A5J5BZ43_9ASTE|nr:hypothetical protein F0562_003331 [Nyssa sinensis]
MVDLGDEFLIGSYRIPWLLWIQLLVMFLLIILLYHFTIFSLDLSYNSAVPSSSTALLTPLGESHIYRPLPNITATVTSCLHNTKVGENQSINGYIGTSTSRRTVRGGDIQEREGSSTKDAVLFEHSYHPCHFFGLAKQAFLRCLGLDSISESSPKRKKGKDQ